MPREHILPFDRVIEVPAPSREEFFRMMADRTQGISDVEMGHNFVIFERVKYVVMMPEQGDGS